MVGQSPLFPLNLHFVVVVFVITHGQKCRQLKSGKKVQFTVLRIMKTNFTENN